MEKFRVISSILVLLVLFSSAGVAQHTITMEITGLQSNDGFIYLELLDINQKPYKRVKGSIKNKQCTLVIKQVETGMYGARYFHDENLNEEMDTNLFGIPKEGFGFSNDALGAFGPKPYEEWLFDVKKDTVIKMKSTYL